MMMTNAIRTISPYYYSGLWVFDDPVFDLVREPFIGGMPEIIEHSIAEIADARKGFNLLFSDHKFPGHHIVLMWQRSDGDGNWYKLDGTELDGWLCPALFHYFTEAPKTIYCQIIAKPQTAEAPLGSGMEDLHSSPQAQLHQSKQV